MSAAPAITKSRGDYNAFDASIGVESARNWTALVWVRNLTNKYYWTNALLVTDSDHRTPPYLRRLRGREDVTDDWAWRGHEGRPCEEYEPARLVAG